MPLLSYLRARGWGREGMESEELPAPVGPGGLVSSASLALTILFFSPAIKPLPEKPRTLQRAAGQEFNHLNHSPASYVLGTTLRRLPPARSVFTDHRTPAFPSSTSWACGNVLWFSDLRALPKVPLGTGLS